MANFVANLQQTKKRKLKDENRMFQTRWTFEYFFIENTDKRPLCLICKQTVNATKECNVKRHYKTMHSKDVYGKLAGHNRELKVKQLQEELKIQRLMIRKMHSDSEKAVRCSYLIALRIAKSMKPYSDGNFVKQCIMDIAQEMCPKMKCEFGTFWLDVFVRTIFFQNGLHEIPLSIGFDRRTLGKWTSNC
ncbi:unnamed protein product [Clavelina lepadiformis]|uniref:SPIN-DOC-like zinc-finger domain-containing protein n=1 Tax=Clavelina lepadiformis TaxID=159417 RepID=A0ABP0FLJ8_CLALP